MAALLFNSLLTIFVHQTLSALDVLDDLLDIRDLPSPFNDTARGVSGSLPLLNAPPLPARALR